MINELMWETELRDVYAVGWVTDEAMVYGARDKGVEFDGDSEVFEEYDATGDGDYGVEAF